MTNDCGRKLFGVFVSRGLSHVDCDVSLLDQPLRTQMLFEEVLEKTTSAIRMVEESSIFLSNSNDELIREFKGTELALRVSLDLWVGTGWKRYHF